MASHDSRPCRDELQHEKKICVEAAAGVQALYRGGARASVSLANGYDGAHSTGVRPGSIA
ncbi:MAG: hypothetical protein PWP40_1548 [Rhodocyclaceae bacterium]|nr:hypothetical protein [Rhodocyclaceae bacterium]